jgi:4-diphosphocytidyl-2-C-methyl-D-erythritol kinase
MIRTARIKAYAKLNLGLRVLYPRPDGYHELRTVFQTISLADRLDVTFRRARITRIEIEDEPHIPDNLAATAARLVLERLEVHGEVRLRLRKRIPRGAGLGGGSSDAAAVLLALPVLAGKDLAPEQRAELAGQLGSDVPFFLYGGTALGLGRGEELYPLPDRHAAHALLIAPDIHSSTAEAYRSLSRGLTSIPLQNKLVAFQQEVWRQAASAREVGVNASGVNDFEEVVFARYPELSRIKSRLRRLGAEVSAMTGSGCAIFGIFQNRNYLERARKSFPADTVFAISFLSRSQYRGAWRSALKLHTKGDLWPPRSLYAR